MKIFISIVLLMIYSGQYTKAQVSVRSSFETNFVNPSTYIFEQNPKIAVVNITYIKGQSQVVNIYYKGREDMTSTMNERYDLFFAGDRHLFRKKYPKFEIPSVPEFRMTYLPNIKTDPAYQRNFFYVATQIKRDSIKQKYSFYTAEGESEARIGYTGGTPHWKGDISKLSGKLSEGFSKWKTIESVDTIMILQGVVTRKGELKPLELIEGATFPYADKLTEMIQTEATGWNPAIVGSVPVDWHVRIAITRKQNQRLAVSIL